MQALVMKAFEYMKLLDPGFAGVKKQVVSESQLANEGQVSVYKLDIHINVLEAMNSDVSLASLVVNEPDLAAKVFQQLLYVVLKSLCLVPLTIELSQVHAVLKISSVPAVPGIVIDSYPQLCYASRQQRLCVIDTKLLEVSAPMQYTQAACYLCPVEGCEGSQGFKYVRIHVPGAVERSLVSAHFTCEICGERLREDQSRRRLSAKRILYTCIHSGSRNSVTRSSSFSTLTQRIAVVCRDETALMKLSLGEVLQIAGRPVSSVSSGQQSIPVLEAEEVRRQVVPPGVEQPHLSNLPPSIAQLYKERMGSPWSFVLILAYLSGEGLSPAGTFVKLKMALLFSLVMGDNSVRSAVFLTLVDTALTTRLLHYFMNCRPESMVHSTLSSLFGEVRSDAEADYIISGGSCLISNCGICCIDDITTLHQQEERHLLRALEYRNILLPGVSSIDTVSIDVKCTIWAGAEKLQHQKSKSRLKTRGVKPAVHQLFDLVILTDGVSKNYLDQVTHQSLVLALHPEAHGHQEKITLNDLQQYVAYVRKITVSFPEDVKSYLAKFYLASRQARQHSQTLLPMSLPTLLSLAEAHCRLSLRTVVSTNDALAAVLLYEECLSALTSHSVLGVTHEPHWRPEVVEYYLTKQNDKGMQLLRKSLDAFLSAYNKNSEE